MEALSLPRRSRLARAAQTAAAPGVGTWLLGLLVLAVALAAFGGGAIELPVESRLQVAIAALGLTCGVGVAAGALHAPRVPLAWAGAVLLAGFAVWSALSVTWSAAPDLSWVAANRAIAYAAVVAIALIAAASTREAPTMVAVGLASVTAIVALYALGGKILPGLHLGPFDLDPGGRFARLRAPLDYWNALGLICVMASPALIWLSTSRVAAPSARVGGLVGLALVVLTAALTYSRGAIIAYVAVICVMVGAGPRRLPRLAVGAGALVAMMPAVIVAFTNHGLSAPGLTLAEREGPGLMLGAIVAVSLIGLGMLGWELIKVEASTHWTAARSRRVWRGMAIAVVAVLVVGTGALAASGRGLPGEISHQIDAFKTPKDQLANTPERLVSTNGSNRYIWWEEALGAFSDKPIAGWGAGSFPTLHFLYRRYAAPVRSTHNVPLQFLSETGLIGTTLGLGGLVLLFAGAISGTRRATGPDRAARLVLLAAAAAWAAHSLYDWDWEIPAVTIPALLALCVAAVPPASKASINLRAGPSGAVPGAVAAVAALAFAVSALLPATSEGLRLNALQQARSGNALGDRAAEADLAHRLDPLSLEPLFTEGGIATLRSGSEQALRYFSEAALLQPDSWEGWRRVALTSIPLGDRATALKALARWAHTDPLYFRGLEKTFSATRFLLEAPPSRSPTAFGTPPP